MQPLQERLATDFTTVSVDWPGFGELAKPRVDWRPEIYDAYVTDLFTRIVPSPYAVIAAGHAAGYLLRHCARHQPCAERLVLMSPTWRGPLPTMVGGERPLFRKIVKAFDPPLVGPILYRLNVNRWVIGMMARGHVYSDPSWLRGARLKEKLAVARAPGARHASVRFVTGRLDPFRSRKEQMEAVQGVTTSILNLFAETAPNKSRLEMEALSALPGVDTARLPQGKLSFYEEFPEQSAEAIRAFLKPVRPN